MSEDFESFAKEALVVLSPPDEFQGFAQDAIGAFQKGQQAFQQTHQKAQEFISQEASEHAYRRMYQGSERGGVRQYSPDVAWKDTQRRFKAQFPGLDVDKDGFSEFYDKAALEATKRYAASDFVKQENLANPNVEMRGGPQAAYEKFKKAYPDLSFEEATGGSVLAKMGSERAKGAAKEYVAAESGAFAKERSGTQFGMAPVRPMGDPSSRLEKFGKAFTPPSEQEISSAWGQYKSQVPDASQEGFAEKYVRAAKVGHEGAVIDEYAKKYGSEGDWLSKKVSESLPFTGSVVKALESGAVATAFGRIEKGEASPDDYRLAGQFVQESRWAKEKGWLGKAGDIISALPGFAVEILATGGIYSAAKTGVAAGIARSLGGGMASRAAQMIVPRVAGVGLQTLANPQRIAEATVREAVNKYGLSKDDAGNLRVSMTQAGKSLEDAAAAGYLDTFIELGTERAGRAFTGEGVRSAVAALPKPVRDKALQMGIVQSLLNKGGDKTQVQKWLAQAGQHGLFQEFAEERLGDVLRGLTGLSEDFGALHQLAKHMVTDPEKRNDAISQLVAEGIAFAAPGLAGRVAGGAPAEAAPRFQQAVQGRPEKTPWQDIVSWETQHKDFLQLPEVARQREYDEMSPLQLESRRSVERQEAAKELSEAYPEPEVAFKRGEIAKPFLLESNRDPQAQHAGLLRSVGEAIADGKEVGPELLKAIDSIPDAGVQEFFREKIEEAKTLEAKQQTAAGPKGEGFVIDQPAPAYEGAGMTIDQILAAKKTGGQPQAPVTPQGILNQTDKTFPTNPPPIPQESDKSFPVTPSAMTTGQPGAPDASQPPVEPKPASMRNFKPEDVKRYAGAMLDVSDQRIAVENAGGAVAENMAEMLGRVEEEIMRRNEANGLGPFSPEIYPDLEAKRVQIIRSHYEAVAGRKAISGPTKSDVNVAFDPARMTDEELEEHAAGDNPSPLVLEELDRRREAAGEIVDSPAAPPAAPVAPGTVLKGQAAPEPGGAETTPPGASQEAGQPSPVKFHVHPAQATVVKKRNAWLRGEGGAFETFPEPMAKMTDSEIASVASREPLPMPETSAEALPLVKAAWDVVSRLWPEAAELVTSVRTAVIPGASGDANAGMNRKGMLVIGEGREMSPQTLFHELVHRVQEQEGRFVDRKDRTDAQHIEMEMEAYARQGQMNQADIFGRLEKASAALLGGTELDRQRKKMLDYGYDKGTLAQLEERLQAIIDREKPGRYRNMSLENEVDTMETGSDPQFGNEQQMARDLFRAMEKAQATSPTKELDDARRDAESDPETASQAGAVEEGGVQEGVQGADAGAAAGAVDGAAVPPTDGSRPEPGDPSRPGTRRLSDKEKRAADRNLALSSLLDRTKSGERIELQELLETANLSPRQSAVLREVYLHSTEPSGVSRQRVQQITEKARRLLNSLPILKKVLRGQSALWKKWRGQKGGRDEKMELERGQVSVKTGQSEAKVSGKSRKHPVRRVEARIEELDEEWANDETTDERRAEITGEIEALTKKREGFLREESGAGLPGLLGVQLNLGEFGKSLRSGLATVGKFLKGLIDGHLPGSAFTAKLERDAKVREALQKLTDVDRDFRETVQKVYGKAVEDLDPSLLERMASALEADMDPARFNRQQPGQWLGLGTPGGHVYQSFINQPSYKALPPEIQQRILQMRMDIDNLTVQLIAAGAIEGDLLLTVDQNIGTYVTRAYRVFNDPKWADKVDPAVRNAAKAWLRQELLAIDPLTTDAQVDREIETLLYAGKAGELTPIDVIRRSKLGGKDLSILKRKKDVPPELRALWGEYRNPLANYATSMAKMSAHLANQEFLNQVAQEGRGVFLFDPKQDRDIPAEAKVNFEDDNLGPLKGMATFPEVKKAFEAVYKKDDLPTWVRVFLGLNSAVKYGKTIFSPTTHARNFSGNAGFAIAQGHWRAGEFSDAVKAVATSLGKNQSQQSREYLLKLIRLGVIGDGVHEGDFRGIVDDAVGAKGEVARFLDKHLAVANGRPSNIVTAASMAKEGIEKLYHAEDAFWKAYAFENEVARYKKAYPGWTQDRVEAKAAEIVRNTYPTYSMIPSVVQKLRRIPFVGKFFSFPSEVVRTGYHTLKLIAEEMKAPETRGIAAQRIVGVSIMAAAPAAAAMIARAVLGMRNDDDELARRLIPDWAKNAHLVWTSFGEGNASYINLAHIDPYSYLRKPLMALMRGEDWEAKLTDAFWEASEPFISLSLPVEAVWEARKNAGNRVFNPQDEPWQRSKDITAFLWKELRPGIFQQAERVLSKASAKDKGMETLSELIQTVSGWRISEVDGRKSLSIHGLRYERGKSEAMEILTDAAKKKTVSEKELRDAYSRMEVARRKLFDGIYMDYQAARRMGIPEKEAREILENAGLSSGEAGDLIKGKYTAYKPTDRFLEAAGERSGDKKGFDERRKTIQRIADSVR